MLIYLPYVYFSMDGIKIADNLTLEDVELPYRLYQKSKEKGIWDPVDIDLKQDKEGWKTFTEAEREQFLRLSSGFYDGEEVVTRSIAPWFQAINKLEDPVFDPVQESMFLTTHAFEEAKHMEFFSRYHEEIFGRHDTDTFRVSRDRVFNIDRHYQIAGELRKNLDQDQQTLIHKFGQSLLWYTGIQETLLASTGLNGFTQMIENKSEQLGYEVLPGFREGLKYIASDEGRHRRNGHWLAKRLAEMDDNIVVDVYQPMLRDYVDHELLANKGSYDEELNPLDVNPERYVTIAKGRLQELIDRLGPQGFEEFSDVDAILRRRQELVD